MVDVDKFIELRDYIIEKHYAHLNSKQREAVLHGKGPLLILAGAGSGKTTVMVNRIAYLIKFGDIYSTDYIPENLTKEQFQEIEDLAKLYRGGDSSQIDIPDGLLSDRGVNPLNILAITFTNKAANEMLERVSNLIGHTAQNMWIRTFHSACVLILRRFAGELGYRSNFVIYDTSDQQELIKECLKELNINEKNFPPRDVLSYIGRIKDRLLSPKEFEIEANGNYRDEQIAKIYTKYQDKLKSNNAFDFDDLIGKTVELFRLKPQILEYYQRRFHHVLVDEYQDTNYAQYTLIKLLSGHHKNICVVGDDDQSIYGWRGADIKNILDFEREFKDTKVVKLEENYRSTQTILEAANQVICHNTYRKSKELWTRGQKGDKICLYEASSEWEEAEFICSQIQSSIIDDNLRPGDFAVLYRLNTQSRVIEETLIKYAIPYRIYGGYRFYDRKEIKDIISYLRVIANPADDISLRRIINTPRRGIGAVTLERLEALAEDEGESIFGLLIDMEERHYDIGRGQKNVSASSQLITQLLAIKEVMPLSEFIRSLIEMSGYRGALDSNNAEDRERIENLDEFINASFEFEKANPDAGLTDFLENIALITDLDRLDDDQSAITLMTLHSAKGLEFPVVFMAGMEEGLFPSSRSSEDEDRLEEERRLCYVGITRAKSQLFISYAKMRNLYGNTFFNSPSRFLGEIDDRYLDKMSFGDSIRKKRDSAHISKAPTGKRFNLGDKVMHTRFGRGTVVAIEDVKGDSKLSIAFEQGGIRKFLESLVPLKKL
ncbi:MAG: UvrD-helicase domain-containing protein [Clostridiales bacterium]|nr:UvrD-helicase domain-containing protein [Clostridiales bacterium]